MPEQLVSTYVDNFGNENEIVVFWPKAQTFHSLDAGWHFGSVSKSMVEGFFYSTKKNWSKRCKVYMNSPVLSIDYDNRSGNCRGWWKNTKESYENWSLRLIPIIPPIKGVEIVPGNRNSKQLLKIFNSLNCAKTLKKWSKIERQQQTLEPYRRMDWWWLHRCWTLLKLSNALVRRCLGGYRRHCLKAAIWQRPDIMAKKNLEDHNIRLALGRTVQAVEGDGKEGKTFCNRQKKPSM